MHLLGTRTHGQTDRHTHTQFYTSAQVQTQSNQKAVIFQRCLPSFILVIFTDQSVICLRLSKKYSVSFRLRTWDKQQSHMSEYWLLWKWCTLQKKTEIGLRLKKLQANLIMCFDKNAVTFSRGQTQLLDNVLDEIPDSGSWRHLKYLKGQEKNRRFTSCSVDCYVNNTVTWAVCSYLVRIVWEVHFV